MEIEKVVKKYCRKFLGDITSPTLEKVDYGPEDIKAIIPHREPFFFLDRITGIDLENNIITGRKKIDPNDPVFKGHFPGMPVYPGLLQVETIGQLALSFYPFFKHQSTVLQEIPGLNIRVTRLHHVLFQHEVNPGDDLLILAKLLEYDDYMYKGIGQVIADQNICTIAVGEFYLL